MLSWLIFERDFAALYPRLNYGYREITDDNTFNEKYLQDIFRRTGSGKCGF
jgi:hypothetical protein